MDPLQALWHLVNFFLPAMMLAGWAAALAKLMWPRALRPLRWWSLAAPASAVCSLVSLLGLVWTQHDGRMATYGAMVVACALTLWWRGFGPGRR